MSTRYGMLVATVDSKRPKETLWTTLKNSNGTDWITEDIKELQSKYQEQLQTTPAGQIMAVHLLDVELQVDVTGCDPEPQPTPGEPDTPATNPDDPGTTGQGGNT